MKLSVISSFAAALSGLLLAGCAAMNRPPRQIGLLPATKSVGEMQVTLEKFETGLSRAQTELGADELAGDAFTRAAFSFKDAGRPSGDWDLAGWKLVAPGGAERPQGSARMSWPTNGMNLYLPGLLSPQAPAWKFNLWFFRDDNFPEQEQWTIKNLPVPGPDEWLAHPAHTCFHGRKVQFTAICGAQVGPTNGYPVMGRFPNVHLFAPGKLRVRPVKATAHFADGRADETIEHFWIISSVNKLILTPKPPPYETTILPTEYYYGIGIDMPDGVKTIDLTLAVTKVRRVVFTAKPVLTARDKTVAPGAVKTTGDK